MDGVALIDLPDWQLVISDDDEDAFEGRLSKLTLLGPAVACRINEHVMYSEARGYQAGENIWSVVHDPNGDESLYSLKISGNPPEQLDAIVRDVKAAQDSQGGEEADVDFIFDVAPKLAESICGFMLGEGELDAIRYTSLKPIGSPEPQRSAVSSRGCSASAGRLAGNLETKPPPFALSLSKGCLSPCMGEAGQCFDWLSTNGLGSCSAYSCPWQCLYLRPEPHGQGALRLTRFSHSAGSPSTGASGWTICSGGRRVVTRPSEAASRSALSS